MFSEKAHIIHLHNQLVFDMFLGWHFKIYLIEIHPNMIKLHVTSIFENIINVLGPTDILNKCINYFYVTEMIRENKTFGDSLFTLQPTC